MAYSFAGTLSALRTERGISQRAAAADLRISQALLSHYENGIREPGLVFVCRACDYYGVSADYLLGRSTERGGPGGERERERLAELAARLRELTDFAEGP